MAGLIERKEWTILLRFGGADNGLRLVLPRIVQFRAHPPESIRLSSIKKCLLEEESPAEQAE